MAETPGFTATRAAPRSLAGLASFRDQEPFRAALLAMGLTAPTTPSVTEAGGITLSCLAPGRYLASAAAAENLPARFAASLAGLAAITDQSDMWDIFTLRGPRILDALAQRVPIDLTPSHFRIGDLALTRAGHLDVRLWRIDEQGYEIATTRSYGQNLAESLGILES